MRRRTPPPYNRVVLRARFLKWLTLGAVAVGLILLVAGPKCAQADSVVYSVGSSPIVNIKVEGWLAIKAWDRQAVRVDSDGPTEVRAFNGRAVAAAVQKEIQVITAAVRTRRGLITLPAESFVVSTLGNQLHDGIAVRGASGHTTVYVPQSTALVAARAGRATINIEGYHGGTFFLRVHRGAVRMQNMGGEGFVQVVNGTIVAEDSSFARLRARTADGNMFFERCHARQIEASSALGSIVYDDGSFEAGLARFESKFGRVAVGIGTGGALVNAHSGAGNIRTNFERFAKMDVRQNDAQGTIGGGGPMVSISAGGAVLLYDHSIRSRQGLDDGWNQRIPRARKHRVRTVP